jgi:hypothetical protein
VVRPWCRAQDEPGRLNFRVRVVGRYAHEDLSLTTLLGFRERSPLGCMPTPPSKPAKGSEDDERCQDAPERKQGRPNRRVCRAAVGPIAFRIVAGC